MAREGSKPAATNRDKHKSLVRCLKHLCLILKVVPPLAAPTSLAGLCIMNLHMKSVPREESLPVKLSHIPWAPQATNALALRSILLQQSDNGTEMYVQHDQQRINDIDARYSNSSSSSSSVIVKLPQPRRFMLIGNLHTTSNYQQACQSILDVLLPQQQQKQLDAPLHHQHQQQQQQQQQAVPVRFRALPAAAVPDVRAVMTRNSYHEVHCYSGYQYVIADGLLKQQLLQPDLQQRLLQGMGAEQYEIGVLGPEDAAFVNDCWIYKAPGSLQQIQQVITSGNHTSCIRHLPERTPVAWALEMEPGFLGVLHTVEQHRRKGLGRAVVMDLLRKLLMEYTSEAGHFMQLEAHPAGSVSSAEQSFASCGTASSRPAPRCPASAGSGCIGSVTGNAGSTATRKYSCVTSRPVDGGSQTSSSWAGGQPAVYCYAMKSNYASIALLESVGLTRTEEYWWMGFEQK